MFPTPRSWPRCFPAVTPGFIISVDPFALNSCALRCLALLSSTLPSFALVCVCFALLCFSLPFFACWRCNYCCFLAHEQMSCRYLSKAALRSLAQLIMLTGRAALLTAWQSWSRQTGKQLLWSGWQAVQHCQDWILLYEQAVQHCEPDPRLETTETVCLCSERIETNRNE